MIGRLRLIDAVAIAAAAMLCLKGVEYLLAPSARVPQAQVSPASVVPGSETLPGFARVLAHARSNYVPPDVLTTGATPDKAAGQNNTPAPASAPDQALPPTPASPSERALLERLGERRDALKERSRDIELREKLLENAEKKLETRINELKAAEERAEGAAAKRGETTEAALKNLVLMYETMKPKDAARVFDRLSLDVLVPVVLQMNPRKMAEVLAVMTPEAAEKLTVALATRARSLDADPPRRAEALPANELPAIPLPQQR